MNLALFDLDNTLLAGDSDFQWAQFLIERGALDRELHESRNLEFYEQYKAGMLDIHEFLDFQLKPLARHSRSQLDVWHSEFMTKKILPLITINARKLIEKHRLDGDLCIIITATNSFVTAPIAQALGINNLIATEPEQKNGEFTGKVSGIPCFREGKITRLENWLDEHNLTWLSFLQSWFYSDSLNDLPLLRKVTHPVAVDPDATLKNHAEQNNWPVISLR
ncbi:HAD-superfamily subfamily IB hydrolase, TIGR01490 [Nitrosomonas cryotolerans]|uniref:Histidinol-phosphatase n=1 Tax=Nitrosomonas cryotolerans ATCC 49181 TaxID=1131553 RepID=A0A1N6JDN4_9PROT|nr:HAD family hydrolase [Nitrosomonas cryotolerans]SFP49294.1 HAD-superfamily subfamily IB hydrolase, TIGR01490 [Nitrosomonas cryotolerans]SIO42226.1 HAD-superfamily subfamily IB hydrolase, TIGR01490 [Nitrosomonas cryotolerans ATCC 49181]